MRHVQRAVSLGLVLLLLVACLLCACGGGGPAAETAVQPTVEPLPTGLSAGEAATLRSLQQVEGYPLYTMRYHGDYDQELSSLRSTMPGAAYSPAPAWACSLFAALGAEDNRLYGRNFDWEYSPALLLFTDPVDGYASVSMVDIAYLIDPEHVRELAELPIQERMGLLQAPFWPFDGMNEHGLAVGMAAVPSADVRLAPGKPTIGSLGVIRQILDRARDVDEAVSILQSYNVTMDGGVPLHYLIADRVGHSMLVEFYQGEMVLIPNEAPWHLATNFTRASLGESAAGQCWRYDRIQQGLGEAAGRLSSGGALDLLAQAAQEVTQWSVVYGLSTGKLQVVMGRQYRQPHTFQLPLASHSPTYLMTLPPE